jgi:hypothetical protein
VRSAAAVKSPMSPSVLGSAVYELAPCPFTLRRVSKIIQREAVGGSVEVVGAAVEEVVVGAPVDGCGGGEGGAGCTKSRRPSSGNRWAQAEGYIPATQAHKLLTRTRFFNQK